MRVSVAFAVYVFLLGLHPAQAEIAVIVNPANPVQTLTARQVAELYLGRTRSFESGDFAVIADQGRDAPLRAQFFKSATSMSMAQVTAYWSRLKFTGQVQPPQNMEGDAAIVDFVRRHHWAIGYVDKAAAPDNKVKTVLILKE